jgi:hypothetical protein
MDHLGRRKLKSQFERGTLAQRPLRQTIPGRKTHPVPDEYTSLKRNRIAVGLLGCLAGLLVGVPATYLLYGVFFNATTFSFCCAATALALLLAEKARKIVKPEELNWLRLGKLSKPLELKPTDRDSGNKSKSDKRTTS